MRKATAREAGADKGLLLLMGEVIHQIRGKGASESKGLRRVPHGWGGNEGEKGRMGELARRGLMRDDTQEDGDTDKIREAGAHVLTLLQALSDVFDSRGLSGGGEMPGETALLEQRRVVSKGSGVVEHTSPLRRQLLTNRKRATFLSSQKAAHQR